MDMKRVQCSCEGCVMPMDVPAEHPGPWFCSFTCACWAGKFSVRLTEEEQGKLKQECMMPDHLEGLRRLGINKCHRCGAIEGVDTVHRGMGSDLMALCGEMKGISGTDQVKLAYVDEQVTCVECLQKRLSEVKKMFALKAGRSTSC